MRLPALLRVPLRSLLRSPLLYGAAVLAMALGVAAPTTMFSLADGVLRPLPVPDPEGLVHVSGMDARYPSERLVLSARWYAALRDRQAALEGVAAHARRLYDVAGGEGRADRRNGAEVTPNTFGLLGVGPVHGRDFEPADAAPGAERVVMLSHGLWQARFGGDPGVVGRPVQLDGEPHTVVGVMPEGFRFPERQQLWTPFEPTPGDSARGIVGVFGRRGAGVTLGQVNAELAGVSASIREDFPSWPATASYRADGYGLAMMDTDDRMILRVMTLLFGFVLVIACVNVANLLVARAVARNREVAVRAALGAGGRRLALEQLVEAACIAVPGGVLGFLLARAGILALGSRLAELLPFWTRFDVLGPVLIFTLGTVALATLVAGLLPALQALRVDPQTAFRQGGRGGTFRIGRVSRGMLGLQITLSVALLVVAGMATRGVLGMATGADYQAGDIATARWTLRGPTYQEDQAVRGFTAAMLERTAAAPGVFAVAAAASLPDVFSGWMRVGIDGQVYDEPRDRPFVHQNVITPGYFAVLGTGFLQGRDFDEGDVQGSDPVAIVNRPFARRYLGDREPVGARLRFDGPDGEPVTATVVGLVPHVGVSTEHGDPPESVYLPFAQNPRANMALLARAPERAAAISREAVDFGAAADPDVAIYSNQPLDRVIAESRVTERAFGLLFIATGLAALLLAAVGLAGLMAYSVRRRTRELGIRAALGAESRLIVWTALRGSLLQLAIGGLLGMALGAAAARTLGQSVLLGVPADDPVVLTLVPLILLSVGALAAWAPARHATRIPVMEALRDE